VKVTKRVDVLLEGMNVLLVFILGLMDFYFFGFKDECDDFFFMNYGFRWWILGFDDEGVMNFGFNEED